jgi:excisionase family DNA binding protein
MGNSKRVTDWIGEVIADLPKLCTSEEVCGVLRITPRHLYRLVSAGKITAVKSADAGKSRLIIPRASVEAWLRERAEAA